MKSLAVLLAAFPLLASGATILESYQFNVGTMVPDNNPLGVADSRSVVSEIDSITGLELTLTMSGGWNGDLYAYLVHGSGFAVLLNRVGRTSGNLDGSASSGMVLTFSDVAGLDVHTGISSSGLASGTFQPDGRTSDPLGTLNTDGRSAFLSSFTGLNAGGEWTLFVADVASGETATLQSWTLAIQGVPEPATAMLAGMGALLAFRRRR